MRELEKELRDAPRQEQLTKYSSFFDCGFSFSFSCFVSTLIQPADSAQ